MKNKIKVLHVFECFDQGGIENFVMNVFRNIDRNQFEFSFAFITRKKGVFDDEAKDLGGSIYLFDSEKKSFSNYKKSLSRIIKEFGPFDVVHSHMYFFSGYILKIAKRNGVPIRIAHSHDTQKGKDPTFLRKMYESLMRKMIIHNATKLVACSDEAGRYLFKNHQFITLYNGIDVNRFAFCEEARQQIRLLYGITNDDKVYLNVGRMADQKNQLFLIDVFSEIRKKISNSKLLIVGDGDLRQQIETKIGDLALTNDVLLIGNVKNTEDYYSASDVFIMPSKYEGLGIVATEAQCSGLPVFASNHVPREVSVASSFFFLDLNRSPKDWAEYIYGNSATGDRSSSYQVIKDTKFDIRETVRVLSNIYKGK